MSDVAVVAEPGPVSARERKRASRERSENAYARSRNACEREVMGLMRERHRDVYDNLRHGVDAASPGEHRSVRHARLRTACAQWFRKTRRKQWDKILDDCIADVVNELHAQGIDVVITRRKIG